MCRLPDADLGRRLQVGGCAGVYVGQGSYVRLEELGREAVGICVSCGAAPERPERPTAAEPKPLSCATTAAALTPPSSCYMAGVFPGLRSCRS